MTFESFRESIVGLGIAREDAEVIADCMVTKKTCSWVNTEAVTPDHVAKINAFISQHSIPIFLKVDSVPTRGKFIWEVRPKK
jgi:hypothetical protein